MRYGYSYEAFEAFMQSVLQRIGRHKGDTVNDVCGSLFYKHCAPNKSLREVKRIKDIGHFFFSDFESYLAKIREPYGKDASGRLLSG